MRERLPLVTGDVVSGAGLGEALQGVDVAYYLVHSMEPGLDGRFAEHELRGAENFAAAARAEDVRRVIYLGGLLPAGLSPSAHLASRLAVEETLLGASPESVSLRASIAIGAHSRSFRLLVRLVERLRVVPLPAWHTYRTQPLDERDMLEFLARALDHPAVAGRSLDIAGPDILTYGEMIERIADLMLVRRSALRLGLTATPVASRLAARIAGEHWELVGPLMEGLSGDLLPRDDRAARLLGVRLHSFTRAVEHALRAWETSEPLAAR